MVKEEARGALLKIELSATIQTTGSAVKKDHPPYPEKGKVGYPANRNSRKKFK